MKFKKLINLIEFLTKELNENEYRAIEEFLSFSEIESDNDERFIEINTLDKLINVTNDLINDEQFDPSNKFYQLLNSAIEKLNRYL